ncbi:MAG: HPP family protein [Patescibacteria group bacterium]
MAKKITRDSIIAGVLVAFTVGLMVLVFSIFEDAVGHGIAIASLAATTTIVVFQHRTRAGDPKTVVIGYVTAAAIGVLVGFLPESLLVLQVLLGVVVLIVVLFTLDRMHPPAAAYLFGFILGDYGFVEFFLTLMALMAFFVSLAVTVFLIEQVSLLVGFSKKEGGEKGKPKGYFSLMEYYVDKAVPFLLVLLFASILSQFLYPEVLEPFGPYFDMVDQIVILFLIVDLGFKFKEASSATSFFRRYWLELIAVLPFFIVVRAFQGLAVSAEFLTKGALSIPVGSQTFLRFLRPMARFPRFLRMLDNLESLGGFNKK